MMESLRVYNTLTQQLENLRVENDKIIRIFVCGPTVYDYSHLGHAKTYIQFDFIAKYLTSRGYDVKYLQNITDIDDKIIQRSMENGEDWRILARHFEKEYLNDMRLLHVTSVTQYARATEHIDEIISQVSRLIDSGFAYVLDDGVYFEIKKFKGYGKLSKRDEVQKNDAISRIDSNGNKRGWNDFCLWKFSKREEPVWNAPFGAGRPGWHIEDTAIAEKYFGFQYEIHGGAVDLIFPHHEAEIAQMEALSGKVPFVRYWMHTGFLNIESEKMSKSLGNYTTIRDAVALYDPRVLRFFFISSQYRSSIDFGKASLEQAKNSLERMEEFIFRIERNFDDTDNEESVAELKKSIDSALVADFNTPKAFAAIFDFIKHQNVGKKNGVRVWSVFQEINFFLEIFQFNQEASATEHIDFLVQERDRYRKEKNFLRADEIRDTLLKMGVRIYDSEGETKYRR